MIRREVFPCGCTVKLSGIGEELVIALETCWKHTKELQDELRAIATHMAELGQDEE